MMTAIPRRNVVHYKGEFRDICTTILQGKLKEGSYIKQFEEEFAGYIGTRYAVAVASGKMGLSLILEALLLNKEDQVILPAYTDESVPGVIVKAGFEPVFVDIDKRNHNIDPGLIEAKITKKSRVIIATHLFGRACELSKILEIAKRHKLIVIEDCAHAIGAKYNGQRLGSIGRAAYFSFGMTKPLNTFGGGIVTTNDPDLYARIKARAADFIHPTAFTVVKNIFISYSLFLVTRPLFFSIIIFPVLFILSFFDKDLVNIYNKTIKRAINFGRLKIKYTNIQALAGLKQLQYFEEENRRRIRNAALLTGMLDKGIGILENDSAAEPIYYFFVVLTHDTQALSGKLLRRGIDSGKHLMRNCAEIYGKDADYPCTEQALRTSLQIPVYPRLNDRDIRCIALVLNQIFKNSHNETVSQSI